MTVLAALTIPIAVAAPAGAAPPGVANVAHRGASAHAPENTIAALRLAARQGADAFEIDVQETRDHELILMHDSTLARTTDAETVFPDRSPWRVADFTLDEIRRLDAGSWFGAAFAGERVPTLAEALRAMRGTDLGLLLEIKAPQLYPGIDRRTVRELRLSWVGPLVVQSVYLESRRSFHDLEHGSHLGMP